jgi:hypothetical protein
MPLMHMANAVLAGLAGLASATWPTATFAAFAQAAAPAAVAALWQSAAVAVALVLSMRLAPRVSAAHRFAAWAAGFAVVANLPFLPLLAHSGDVSAAAPLAAGGARPWLELDNRWGFAIAAMWLAASAFRAAELAFQSLRLRELWRGATPVEAEENLRALLDATLPARPPERPIEICTTRELDRPSVIGFLKPRILIPEWLFSRLTAGELDQVVLHEAEHLRRRDDWTNLLQKLFLVVFPLNARWPATKAWFGARRLRALMQLALRRSPSADCNSGNCCGAPRRFRWAHSSAGQNWFTACTVFCGASRRSIRWRLARWLASSVAAWSLDQLSSHGARSWLRLWSHRSLMRRQPSCRRRRLEPRASRVLPMHGPVNRARRPLTQCSTLRRNFTQLTRRPFCLQAATRR